MPLIYPKSRVLARRKQMVWEQMHSGLGPALEQAQPKRVTCPPKPSCCKKRAVSPAISSLQCFPLSANSPCALGRSLHSHPPFPRVFLVPVQPLARFA